MYTSAYEGKGPGKETVLLWEGNGATEGTEKYADSLMAWFLSALFSDSVGSTVIYLMKVSERTNPML